jgi:hypothetical protein
MLEDLKKLEQNLREYGRSHEQEKQFLHLYVWFWSMERQDEDNLAGKSQ